MNRPYRHTKIVFTVGPATDSVEMLIKLLEQGVDVMRLNMAHADESWTRRVLENLEEASRQNGRQISVMMDVKGPEIRTGDLEEPLDLKAGDTIFLYVDKKALPKREEQDIPAVTVNYPGLHKDVKIGDTVLVDSGLIRMKVEDKDDVRIKCVVKIPGPLGNRRHINLPGVKVNLPCLTRKDKTDIKLGIELGIEFFALSFVREADDLDILRRYISDHGSEAKVIAKIEDQSAITNLDNIIRACDGLMVARGDLGIEVPYEDLPVIQRRAVQTCRQHGKPVIIATHMLESMIESPMPTRAEITDVANAVMEQADCVMLSGETTVGQYPTECVEVLNRIISKVEHEEGSPYNSDIILRTPKAKLLRSAVILGHELDGAALLVFTRSGFLAQILAALRPRRSPVFAFTDVPMIFKQMLMLWGIEPFYVDFDENPEATIQHAFELLKENAWVEAGHRIVVISTAFAGEQVVETIQLRTVE